MTSGRPWTSGLAPLAVVMAAALPAERAQAQEPATDSAADLFRAGQAAHARGDHAAAARAFLEAHRRVPSGRAIYNAGRSFEAAGDRPAAANAYAAALDEPDLAGPQRDHAESRLGALRDLLGTVELRGPPGALGGVAGAEPRRLPTTWMVPPGEHRFEWRLPNGDQRSAVVRIGAGQRQSLSAPAPLPASSSPPPGAAPTAGATPARSSWLGWTGVGVAAVSSGAAIVLGFGTLGARDEFVDAGRTDRDARDQAVGLRALTNVAWGLAAVGGALAVVGFWPDAPTERARVIVGPGSLALAGSF